MIRSSKKLPKDANQLAAAIVRLSTGETETLTIGDYLSSIGRKGGLKGGPARAKKLSARRRKKIARNAASARWKKKAKL
jgi:hypothetical protein